MAPISDPAAKSLPPDLDAPQRAPAGPAAGSSHSTGVLPSQDIRAAIASGDLLSPVEILEDQIQPASLDLRLGDKAYRIPASFLPGETHTVLEKVEAFKMYEVDLTEGGVLERGCVYIVPLLEQVAFRKRMSATANPKSSTGRLDIFARVITDHGAEFDHVRSQYKGPLYAEIAPRSFTIRVRQGSRLVQLRLKKGSPPRSDSAVRRLHRDVGLVDEPAAGERINRGLTLTVDVHGDPSSGLIGYRAKKHAGLIDLEKIGHYDPMAFWDRILARPGGGIVLDPDEFYILASRELVVVPATQAAEMVAYDTLVGEFRVHYAGFFDPGFGDGGTGGRGTKAVLEVRSHEVPFLIEERQVVGRLQYERLTAEPDKLYGRDIGSNYQRQGLTLSKQFRR